MAGCNAIVAGSAVFGAPSYADAVAAIKAAWDDETSQLQAMPIRDCFEIFLFSPIFSVPRREVGPEEDRPKKIDPINNQTNKKISGAQGWNARKLGNLQMETQRFSLSICRAHLAEVSTSCKS